MRLFRAIGRRLREWRARRRAGYVEHELHAADTQPSDQYRHMYR